MRLRSVLALTLATSLTVPSASAADPEPSAALLPNLRDLARSRDKHLGTNFGALACISGKDHAVSPDWKERNALDLDLIRKHFTQVSAGWQQFPGKTWIAPDKYCFDGNHAFVDWARSHDLDVQFHGLGYIQRGWPNFDHKRQDEARALYDTPEEQTAFRDTYRRYLDAFLKNFGDKVQSWDVINEHLQYGSYNSKGYNRFPYLVCWGANNQETVYGLDYYLETLRRARELSPKTKLVYLDYNNEIISNKSNSQYVAAKEILARGRLIDAIGFQLHQSNNFNRQRDRDNAGVAAAGINKVTKFHDLTDAQFLDSMRENIQRYADLGLEVWTTELDVAATGSGNLAERRERQAYVYRKLLEVCLEFPNYPAFKTWGVRDKSADGRYGPGDGYLFDQKGNAKPAAFALADAFQHYRPEVLWHRDFTLAAASKDLARGGGAVLQSGKVVLPKAEASVEVPLVLKNTYNAHVSYRWRWTAPPPAGTQIVVEAAGHDNAWRELKRHALTEHNLRKVEGDIAHAAFCTLDGFDGQPSARLRFRYEAPASPAAPDAAPAFELADLKLIADAADR